MLKTTHLCCPESGVEQRLPKADHCNLAIFHGTFLGIEMIKKSLSQCCFMSFFGCFIISKNHPMKGGLIRGLDWTLCWGPHAEYVAFTAVNESQNTASAQPRGQLNDRKMAQRWLLRAWIQFQTRKVRRLQFYIHVTFILALYYCTALFSDL